MAIVGIPRVPEQTHSYSTKTAERIKFAYSTDRGRMVALNGNGALSGQHLAKL